MLFYARKSEKIYRNRADIQYKKKKEKKLLKAFTRWAGL